MVLETDYNTSHCHVLNRTKNGLSRSSMIYDGFVRMEYNQLSTRALEVDLERLKIFKDMFCSACNCVLA